jgi:very-short-patch-repair endonuclease
MHADERIARLAARQRGVVTRAQLRAAGLSDPAIRHRHETGRLHRFTAGTYLVGHTAAAALAHETAALLGCGPDALLSHQSAAALWGIEERAPAVHVTVPRSGPSRPPGVQVHRVRALAATERRRRAGLPVTSPARTLLDLAGVLDAERLDSALERARAARLVTPAEVLAAIERTPRRRGSGTLRRLLEDRPGLTRSRAERILVGLVRRGGLPRPRTNARIAGFEVDVLWPAERVVVEFDGFGFHANRAAFENDRRRDAELQARGYRVLRVTWRRLLDEPEAVLVTIARTLALSDASGVR